MKARRVTTIAAVVGLALFTLEDSALAQAAVAGRNDERPTLSLQGTWQVVGFPGTPSQFFVMTVFNEGGTMTEVLSSGGVSSTSGVWKQIRGDANFAATSQNFFDSDANGSFDLRFRTRQTIHLSDHNTLTGTITVEIVSLDGTTVLSEPVQVPIEGTRMRVVRE
jgi:hypothetical protein